MGTFTKELKQMAESYSAVKANPSGAVPDAIYLLQLQLAEMRKTQAGNLRIYREHLILDGEHAGEVIRDGLNLNNEVGMRISMQWVERCGFPWPEDVTGIEDVVAEIMAAAPTVTAKVKTKDGFTNVDVLRIAEGAEGAGAPPVVTEAAVRGIAPKAKPAAKAAPAPKAAEPEVEVESIVGQTVSFQDPDGNTIEGEVVEQDGELLKVKETNGQEWEEVNISEVTTSEETVAEEEAAAADPDGELRASLLGIAQAHGMEVTDESTTDELAEVLKQYEWDAATLTADEAEALQKAGATVKVKKPALKAPAKAPAKPAPKAPVKPVQKAPAKPAARKPAPKGRK